MDNGPVYRVVFRRLQRESLDWRYTFPRIHVLRFDCESQDQSAPHDYSPSESFAREQQRQSDEMEFARMQADLDATDAAAREEARAAPPPAVVQAFRDVFGRWPDGWPP